MIVDRGSDGFGAAKGCLAVFLCLALTIQLPGNPAGEAVRFGDVLFERQGDTLRIIQGSPNGIINWDSFSIGTGETTRFDQPNSQSATLNRVTGQSVSTIDGRLLANGRVFLLNSNGIVIGRDGMINVAGFAASTLDVSDGEFLAGGELNFRGPSQAAVINLGTVSAFDGDIFLVAATVDNSGFLRAPRGTVGLAAGNDVLIRESGSERVYVRGASGEKKENGVLNKGTVEANIAELKAYGGNHYGMAVKNEGRVSATAVTREGGQIFLRAGGRSPGRVATGGGKVKSTGSIAASRPNETGGGRVTVDAGPQGAAEIGGRIEAGSESGIGGAIVILGNTVEVFGGSVILADGARGGGSIRIGGGLRGEDPEFMNAESVTVGNGAVLSADALGAGDGGLVVAFAEGALRFDGQLTARGGIAGGDGGFAELSGQRALFIDSLVDQVDLSSSPGRAGTLLIDPIDIQILAGTGGGGVSGTTIYANDIAAFLAGASLTISTTDAALDNGDITMAAGAAINWNSAANLTLVADRDFTMLAGSAINATGAGAFSATATRAINLGTLSSITTTNGALTLSANQKVVPTSGNFAGISLNGATVESTGTGVLSLIGRGGDTADGNVGIAVKNGGRIIGGTGGITLLTGSGGLSGGLGNVGIEVIGSASLLSTNGSNLSVVGYGGGTGSMSGSNSGVFVSSGGVITSGAGSGVSVEGTGGGGGGLNNKGVWISQVSPSSFGTITSGGGYVSVTGTGGGVPASTNNQGVDVAGSNVILSTGGGILTVTGIGGANTLTEAIRFSGSVSTTGNQAINLIGDSFSSSSGTINSGTGTTTIRQRTNGLGIDLGGAGVAGTTLGLSDAELDRITAGTVQIGNSDSGRIDVSAAITHANHLSLSTGAGLTINNSITMAPNKNLTINASGTTNGTINLATGNSDLTATGTGAISLTTVRDILLAVGSSILTVDGDLTLSANRQVTPTSGDFRGIWTRGQILVNGSGSLLLEGRGGDSGAGNQHGVIIDSLGNASIVRGGNTGTTIINGISGSGTGDFNYGVGVQGGDSLLTTSGSHLSVIGAGVGSGAGGDNVGVAVYFGGTVTSGSGGNVTIAGTGGVGTGGFNFGVDLGTFGPGTSTLTSGGGAIEITGTGGAGNGSSGISLRSLSLISTAANGGTIHLLGAAASGNSAGIDIQSGNIQSGFGTVTLDGLGSGSGFAIQSVTPGNLLTSGGTVEMKSSGGNVSVLGSVIASGLLLRDATAPGNVDFLLTNLSNDVGLIAANGTGSSGRIGSLDYRDADGFEVGNVSGVSGIAANGAIDLFSAGGGMETVLIATAMSSPGGSITIEGYDLEVSDASILTTGTGTIDLEATRSLLVDVDSVLSVVNGNLTLRANAGANPLVGDFSGIIINDSAISSSGSGVISLTGVGGNNAIGSNSVVDGVRVTGGSLISSTGTIAGAGGIILAGTGGSGNPGNAGVYLSGVDTSISSVVGGISITGLAGDSVSGVGDGVVMNGGSGISSTGAASGAATITIHGTGGDLGSGNRGVVLDDPNTVIQSNNADISITGNGGGQNTGDANRGILINAANLGAAGDGGLELIGNGGLGFSRIDGVQLGSGARLEVENGALVIKGTAGGSLGFGIFATPTSGDIVVSGTGTIEISGSGMNVAGVNLANPNLGGANAGSVLVESLLNDVIVESSTTADGTITFVAPRNVQVGGPVNSTGGDIQFTGRDVTISSLISAPGGDITVEVGAGLVSPGSGGTAAINADLVFGGSLAFVGGAGDEDRVTYAGYSGSPVTFNFDLLDSIENLAGTTFTSDELNGPALAGSYVFTGNDVFEVNGVIVSGFENLIGGAEDDIFSFDAGGSLSGSLDGGGGPRNEISYAGFTTGANLDLEAGTASGILGGFSNIRVFNGSPNIDTVTGLQAPSVYAFSPAGLLTVGGFEVSGFDNLVAGPGADTFQMSAGGGIPGILNGNAGIDTLNYSAFDAPVTVDTGSGTATGFGGITGLESFIGSSFSDIFGSSVGTNSFRIDAANAGNLNGSTTFASFEHLAGGSGGDRFLFFNQATVGSVDGGSGFDILDIDDRNLGGVNTYTVTSNRISRNPTYLFSGIEGIQLLLGPGNDTVVTGGNGLVQTINAGDGFDTLDLGPGFFLSGSPIVLGGSSIFHSGFEAPVQPNTSNAGTILSLQTGSIGGPEPVMDSQVEDQFTTIGEGAGMNGENLLQAFGQLGGNAFAAALAGQAVVIQLNGEQYLLGVPTSLDGLSGVPPGELVRQLRENLSASGWLELAEAIDFEGSMILVSSDGSYAIDLSGGVPADIDAVLGTSLGVEAAQDLFAALEMAIFIPITSADGVVAILAVPIQMDPAIPALLNELLNEAGFAELTAALDAE